MASVDTRESSDREIDEVSQPDDADRDGDESTGPPPAKYKVLDKVLARDSDGLVYGAIVRRALYGPVFNEQVQVGMITSTEAEGPVCGRPSVGETWQYFIHFLKWNVKWDCWVTEDQVLPQNAKNSLYAQTLIREHKALRAAMSRKAPGKKAFQTINAGAFLQAWRKKLDRINNQYRVNAMPSRAMASKPVQKDAWPKKLVDAEIKLRVKGLASKRSQADENTLVLPFTLKKVLVEQWEIINQCGMVARLPASVSVRQALALYLQSKGIEPPPSPVKIKRPNNSSVSPSAEKEEPVPDPDELSPPVKLDDKLVKCENESVSSGDGSEEPVDPKGQESTAKNLKTTSRAMADQEWIRVSEAIVQLFDEALPSRLLYKSEICQRRVLDSQDQYESYTYADLYGCEHLLRLFVRLPALIADTMEEDQSRPLLAKINDFIRFMYKNQVQLFTQAYRKYSEEEDMDLKVAAKAADRKRKRDCCD